jgi:hypothetical protein
MTRLTLAGCVVLGCAGAPALAITPEDLWAAWQAESAAIGHTLTATQTSRAGDTLVLGGVEWRTAPRPDAVAVEAAIGTVLLREAGAGAVTVTMADSFPLTVRGTGEAAGEAVFRISQPGLAIRASGTPDVIAYEMAGPQLRIALESATGGGAAMPAELTLSLDRISASYTTSGRPTQTIDGRFGVGTLGLALRLTETAAQGGLAMTATAADLAGSFDTTLVHDFGQEEDLSALLRAGLAMAAEYRVGAMRFDIDATEAGEQTRLEGTAAGGTFDFALDAGRIAYRTGATGLDVTLAGGGLPFPELDIRLGELAVGLLLPVFETVGPADFEFVTRMVDLVLPEAVWAMADPMGALAHDPVTVILDTAGRLRLTGDLFAPVAPEAMAADTAPAELHALELRELQVTAAGADLAGSGSFTFDNEDLATFEGLPRPTGVLDLRLVGVNTLLDALAAMGMIPEDEITNARVMLGLLARPGEGPDTLVSRIEVTPEGAVLANGQRLR